MDDANQTKEQVIALSNALEKESRRVARWAIISLMFAVAVCVLVAATKSVVFLVVALFAWLSDELSGGLRVFILTHEDQATQPGGPAHRKPAHRKPAHREPAHREPAGARPGGHARTVARVAAAGRDRARQATAAF